MYSGRPAHNRVAVPAGTRFHKWSVLGVSSHRDKKGNLHFDCRCECGRVVPVCALNLRSWKSTQCRECWNSNRLRPFESLFNLARNSAVTPSAPKQPPRDWTLSYEEFCDIINAGRCHYCWAPLAWSAYMSHRSSVNYQMDRKDNGSGYVQGNVVACCKRCNYAKGNRYSYAEWFAMNKHFRERVPEVAPCFHPSAD